MNLILFFGVLSQAAFFRHKTVIIPHDDKKHRMGEDAAIGSNELLVVADGVGGWVRSGIDPGFYSRHLVEGIHTQYKSDPTATPKNMIIRQNPITAKAF